MKQDLTRISFLVCSSFRKNAKFCFSFIEVGHLWPRVCNCCIRWQWKYVIYFSSRNARHSAQSYRCTQSMCNANIISIIAVDFFFPSQISPLVKTSRSVDRGPKYIIFDKPKYILSGDWNAIRIYKTKNYTTRPCSELSPVLRQVQYLCAAFIFLLDLWTSESGSPSCVHISELKCMQDPDMSGICNVSWCKLRCFWCPKSQKQAPSQSHSKSIYSISGILWPTSYTAPWCILYASRACDAPARYGCVPYPGHAHSHMRHEHYSKWATKRTVFGGYIAEAECVEYQWLNMVPGTAYLGYM
jgi:hypothetical protein